MGNDTKLKKINPFLQKWKKDYIFKTMANSVLSFSVTVLFALYNGFLGIRLLSVWHGSICVFYFLLVAIRGMILLTEKNNIIDGHVRKASKYGTYSCDHDGYLYDI